ncbi:hypothetical protein Tco_0533779 [Tanacetum coccineum]
MSYPSACSHGVRERVMIFLFTRFLKLHYWILTLEVSQTSTLTTGVSSLIPSSSRIPTLLGYVANLLAIPTLYSIICYLEFLEQNVYEVSSTGKSWTLRVLNIYEGTAEGSVGARCSSSSSSPPSSFSTSSSSLSSSDDSLS